MADSATKFFNTFVAKLDISLSGIRWDMVTATLDESADNCIHCGNKGCQVCGMTREISQQIKQQLTERRDHGR